ncbi:MAG: response regulator transcription factor [Prevotellaceae bacterium]|nr:response regulator transcription factor [Prevotellaceae bacterium]
MEDQKYQIMVVDDEADLCEILKFNLEAEGNYEVEVAYSAEEALKKGVQDKDLLILDVMMGGMSGFAMAKQLKSDPETAQIPIIFLTARDTENDTVTGFNLGADDYISKPFSIREVLARVKAVLRRTTEQAERKEEQNNTITYKGLQLDMNKKEVTVDGKAVAFTKTEFALLHLLLEEKGKILSRQQLIDRVWPRDVIVLDRTVDVNITRLRRKVGPYAKHIVTRLGFGYGFEE